MKEAERSHMPSDTLFLKIPYSETLEELEEIARILSPNASMQAAAR
jgi:hypothetical protein